MYLDELHFHEFYNIKISVFICITFLYVLWICVKSYSNKCRINNILAKIPGPPQRYPFIGNLDMFLINCNTELNILDYLWKGLTVLYKNEGIFKTSLGPNTAVVIFNSKFAQDFLKCTVNIEKPYEYQLLYDWLGKGLLINDCSDLWRERRKLLTPAFHYKILDEFVPIFNEKTDILLDRLRESADKESVNICDLVFPAALDIITETSTGFKINAQQKENLDYIQAVQDMGRILVNRVINPLLHSKWIFSMTKMGQQFKHNLNVSQTLTRRVIDERKRYLMQNKGNTDLETKDTKDSKTRKRLAFLDLLLDHHLRDNTLSLEDIREEVDTFIFAGHDTTAICLSWTYHFIGLYPEIQRKLHQELDSILTTNCMVTIDDIKRMPYLEAVIKESLRLRPPVPVILRAIKQDIQLGQYVIPRGVTLGLMIDVMHLDPDIYPDPLTFNPERFLTAGEGRDAFSFVPFSAGVRNCIGQKFALNELKIVLAKTLRLYHFQSLEPRDRLIEYNAIVKKPKNGIRIKVSPRYQA